MELLTNLRPVIILTVGAFGGMMLAKGADKTEYIIFGLLGASAVNSVWDYVDTMASGQIASEGQ